MTLRGIRLDPGGDVVDTFRMTDISRSGIGAYTDRPYYPGQRLVLCLPLSRDRGRRNIYATVRRCDPEQEGYRVGLEFDTASVGSWCGVAAETPAAA